MALTKQTVGYRSDGTPIESYVHDGNGEPHLLITGPVTGTITVVDGTRYDVTGEVIECASQDHARQVAHFIGLQHEETGVNGTNPGFVHTCTDDCGELSRTPTAPTTEV